MSLSSSFGQSDLERMRSDLASFVSKRDYALAKIEEENRALEKTKKETEAILMAQSHIQALAQETQKQAHKQITRVVSKCLSSVFQEPYEFKIKFEQRRGRTEADFVFFRNGYEVDPKLTSGGVRDVAALALRLACLIMTQPPARRFIALDEPWKGVSSLNRERVALLIESLAKELKVQFLIVTHDEAFQIGKVVEL